jgi:hypothetical protein
MNKSKNTPIIIFLYKVTNYKQRTKWQYVERHALGCAGDELFSSAGSAHATLYNTADILSPVDATNS